MSHRRASSGRRVIAGLLMLAVGVLVAIAAPVVWSATHRDPGLQAVDSGIAEQLAQQDVPNQTPASTDSHTQASARPPTGQSPSASATGDIPKKPATPVHSASKPSKAATTTLTAAPAPRDRSSAAPRPTSSAAPAVSARTPPRVLQPTRLIIPAIGVNAPVAAVGVDDRGDMAIPAQVEQIGWYRYGAAPGDPVGSVVMSGHVDSAQQGLGAFADLSHLTAGAMVTVADAAGDQQKYRVVGKEAFDKKTVPLADLFSRGGSPRLTLITCGGGFDSVARSYLDNIVITAVPV